MRVLHTTINIKAPAVVCVPIYVVHNTYHVRSIVYELICQVLVSLLLLTIVTLVILGPSLRCHRSFGHRRRGRGSLLLRQDLPEVN
jgi:hypothetical protein